MVTTTVTVTWTSENATTVEIYLVTAGGSIISPNPDPDSTGVRARGGPQGAATFSIPCDGTTQRLSIKPFRQGSGVVVTGAPVFAGVGESRPNF